MKSELISPQPDPVWTPRRHTVFRDAALADQIHRDGYAVVRWWTASQIEQLEAIHAREHRLAPAEGGMFYSVYSQDLDYRRRVHRQVEAVLQSSFDEHFVDYRNVLNMFVVKASGPASEFGIHQDTTALDEFEHSPLSIWTPLCDVTTENGALCLVPRSHHFFSPYRGISFPFPFSNIHAVVREYLQPIPMKLGEALVFDNRLVHHSLPNLSGRNRAAIVSGIFPAAATFQICFKDPHRTDAPIEIYSQEPDWTLEYPNFLHNCHERPTTGTLIGYARHEFPNMDEATFRTLCARHGLKPSSTLPEASGLRCNMIPEPCVQD